MKGKTKTMLLFAIVVLAVIGVSTWTGIKYTGQPSFCASCHSMESYYNTWVKSTHEGVECYTCHVDPGTTEMLKAKLKGLQEVYLTVMNIPAKPEDKKAYTRCMNCHDKWEKENPNSNDPNTFRHVSHLESGLSCAECHKDLVHGEKQEITRQSCVECHNKNPHQPGWRVIHANQVNRSCTTCHDIINFCNKCHRLP